MTQAYELIPTNPCPFCGGKSKITCVRRGNYSRKGDNYQGLCNKCKARGPLVQDDPQLAADKWNSMQLLQKAHELGFLRAAGWVQRDDLFSDVGSPTYRKDRDHDLSTLIGAQK